MGAVAGMVGRPFPSSRIGLGWTPSTRAASDQSGARGEMEPYFEVDFVDRGEALVLVVVGEVDMSTTEVLDHGLVRAEATDAKQIVIDLDRVGFIDAAGLSVLL